MSVFIGIVNILDECICRHCNILDVCICRHNNILDNCIWCLLHFELSTIFSLVFPGSRKISRGYALEYFKFYGIIFFNGPLLQFNFFRGGLPPYWRIHGLLGLENTIISTKNWPIWWYKLSLGFIGPPFSELLNPKCFTLRNILGYRASFSGSKCAFF